MRVPNVCRACVSECVTRVPYSRGFAIWCVSVDTVLCVYNIVAVTVNLPTRLGSHKHKNTHAQTQTLTLKCTHLHLCLRMYVWSRTVLPSRACIFAVVVVVACSRFVVPWIHMCTFVCYCYCDLMLRLCDKSVRMCWRQYSVRCTASNRKRWIGTPQTTMFLFRIVYMENALTESEPELKTFHLPTRDFFPLYARCDAEHRSLLIQHLPDTTDDVITMLFVYCVVLCCEIRARYFKSICWTWNKYDNKCLRFFLHIYLILSFHLIGFVFHSKCKDLLLVLQKVKYELILFATYDDIYSIFISLFSFSSLKKAINNTNSI